MKRTTLTSLLFLYFFALEVKANEKVDSLKGDTFFYFELGSNSVNSSFNNGSLGYGAMVSEGNFDFIVETSFTYSNMPGYDYNLMMFDAAFSPRYNLSYTEDTGFFIGAGIGISSSAEPDDSIYIFDFEDGRSTIGFLTKLKFGYRLKSFELYGLFRRDMTELESFNSFNLGILYRI